MALLQVVYEFYRSFQRTFLIMTRFPVHSSLLRDLMKAFLSLGHMKQLEGHFEPKLGRTLEYEEIFALGFFTLTMTRDG
jgi:hypothetical protein